MKNFKRFLITLTLVVAIPFYALAATQNGSNNVAAASLLTGTTMAANVVTSSLTTVGTLINLTVTNPITGSITGNAATATALATTRAIYGNNFDGSAALTQIIASTYGGTGNGFAKFSGPLTSEKTFTLPNASTTILTTNTAVTAAQGGTGLDSSAQTGIAQVSSGTWSWSTALASGTTATTQSANENSTKVATTAYVDRAASVIPQNSQSTGYTLVLADQGKQILHPSADTTARTFTIPANSSVAYPIGTVITFVNEASAGVLTIAITTDTMYLAGSASSTGNRTLTAVGVATAIKVTSTEWIISGAGLT